MTYRQIIAKKTQSGRRIATSPNQLTSSLKQGRHVRSKTALFSPVPPASAAMHAWFVANCTAVCYPVNVPVLCARLSEYGDARIHNRRRIHDEQHHDLVQRHGTSHPTPLPPSTSSHCCPQHRYVSACVHPRPSVPPRAPAYLYCIKISCNAIDDLMAPNGKLLIVIFGKKYKSLHSLPASHCYNLTPRGSCITMVFRDLLLAMR